MRIEDIKILNNDDSPSNNFKPKVNKCSSKTRSNFPCSIGFVYSPQNIGFHQGKAKISYRVFTEDNQEGFERFEEINLVGGGEGSSVCFVIPQKKVKSKSKEPKKPEKLRSKKQNGANGVIKNLKFVDANNLNIESRDFTIVSQTCTTSKEKLDITIGFTPRKRRIRSAVLLVYYESLSEPMKVYLKGVGTSQAGFVECFSILKDKITDSLG